MRDLTGKKAWITGAGSGIGRGAAVELARAGMHCILSGRRGSALEETAREIEGVGGSATVEVLDVTDAQAVGAVAQRIAELDGPLDTLVNSAGMNILERNWPVASPAGFQSVIDANLQGTFNCCQAALPQMRSKRTGLIINVSSWAGKFPARLTGPGYSAAKAAVVALSTSLNLEEWKNGVRACALCPGEVATPIMDTRPEPPSQEARATMLQIEDMSETILFLARLHERACVNEVIISPTYNCLADSH